VDVVVAAFERGARLFYIGAGTSGRLGVLDAAECPPTFNVPPEMVQGIIAGGEAALARATETTEDDPKIGVHDLRDRGFRELDVLVGIAASGRTPYVLGAVAEANRMGALTIGISCTPDSELARAVKLPITLLVGPEIVAGSTRMKAATATKMVLNMLSTASFIRRGYVFGNLMVNVQPKNSKLADRARRIIARAAGVSYEKAGEMLIASGNSVRTAIVMTRAGVSREEAERRLAAGHGRIAEALRK
jgi:N-acetylmuramic acid 6-phosphate etherase